MTEVRTLPVIVAAFNRYPPSSAWMMGPDIQHDAIATARNVNTEAVQSHARSRRLLGTCGLPASSRILVILQFDAYHPEKFQRLRIRQRFGVLHRIAVDRGAHGEFADLARARARDVGDCEDFRRHVAWRGVGADLMLDPLAQVIVEPGAFAQAHEQDYALVALPALADRDRFQHFRQLFDLAIDFRGTDAHAAGIERCIRATVDDDAVVLGQFGAVAVAPHARHLREIRGAVL